MLRKTDRKTELFDPSFHFSIHLVLSPETNDTQRTITLGASELPRPQLAISNCYTMPTDSFRQGAAPCKRKTKSFPKLEINQKVYGFKIKLPCS